MDVSLAIMAANDVETDQFRAVDFEIAPGVYPDMREHGAARDDWPELYERVQAADILVLSALRSGSARSLPLHAGDRAALRLLEPARGLLLFPEIVKKAPPKS